MAMQIKNGMLYIDGKQVDYKASPNRSGAMVPDIAVVHDTASGLDASGPISWLCNKQAGASAHFVVARDGKITQLVPTNIKAWHAGKSSYNGRANVNNFSVGIEIVNPGWLTSKDGGKTGTFSRGSPSWDAAKYGIRQITDDAHPGKYYWMAYTNEQIDAVIGILHALKAAYPKMHDVVAHWYISPGRKVDTNPLFPLDRVKSTVFNRRGPVPTPNEKTMEEILPPNVPLAKDEKDALFEEDARVTSNLNIRPWPDSPNRFGVIQVGRSVDIIRQSISQVNGKVWYFVKVKRESVLSKEGHMSDADGYYRGFVSADFVELLD